MDQQFFEIIRDFYTHRKEYEVNMAALSRQLELAKRERDRLRESLNELTDFVQEQRKE